MDNVGVSLMFYPIQARMNTITPTWNEIRYFYISKSHVELSKTKFQVDVYDWNRVSKCLL